MVSVCPTCNGLESHIKAHREPEKEAQQWLSTTLPSLRRSTVGGCRACSLLLQGILLHHDRFAGVKEEAIRISAESFSTPDVPQQDAQDHLSVELRWDSGAGESNGHSPDLEAESYPDLKLEFYTDSDGQSPFSAIGRGRHISENPLTDSGLVKARDMIRHCHSSHTRCRQTRRARLPRRILDVLQEDASKGIRLHETDPDSMDDQAEFGDYLTLSHCWGTGTHVLQTTSKSLEAYKRSIPWAALPKTYQDAVLLTRALGFRWLWIDSLCIVQDDMIERLEESLNMDDVFTNSVLTIGATSAADGSAGLFLPKTHAFKIQATDNRGSLFKIYVREQPSHYGFKAPFDEQAHMNDWQFPFNASAEANLQTPLLKRAWGYVERLLSPRVLHFTKSEMILECREGYQCECGRIDDAKYDSRTTESVKQEFANIVCPKELNGHATNGNGNTNGSPRVDTVASQIAGMNIADAVEPSNEAREEAIQLWRYIITEYTARDLTYDWDRLFAISGIAKQFLPMLKSGYIAGQWTFNTLDLLWHPSNSTMCRRPQNITQNIPSWSWASVEGSPIFFDTSIAIDLACTARYPGDKSRTPVWSPTTGEAVQLSAPMTAEVTFRIDAPKQYSLAKNGVSVEFTPDIVPPEGYDQLSAGDTLVVVLVSMTFRSSIIGLVLKASSVNPQVYRRVGRLECFICQTDAIDQEPEDAEALFGYWFPEVEDMMQLDAQPKKSFVVV